MIQHLGTISIFAMWMGTYLLLKDHTPDQSKSISAHAAKNDKYHILFGIVEIVVVTIFSVFMFSWFIPEFELGGTYSLAALVGITGTVFSALVPDRSGWQGNVHFLASYSMAISLMVMNLILLANPNIGASANVLAVVSLCYMSIGWVIAIVRNKLFKRYMLYYQIGYFISFQIPVVLATYFS